MKKIAVCSLLIALLLCACGKPAADGPKEPEGTAPISAASAVPATPAPAPTPEPTPEPAPEPTPEPEPARTIQIEDALLDSAPEGFQMELHYPVITCSEGGVSGDFRGVAEELYNSFVEVASYYSDGTDMGLFVGLDYEVTFQSGDVVSMVFHTTEYTGGAHPNHDVFCRTWTWSSGPLYVQDLFDVYSPTGDSTAFWDSVMAEVARQIRYERGGELYEWAADHVWDGFSLDMLSVADGGVNVYYGEYDLGSYADGEQMFFVPFDKIDATPIEWIAPGIGDPEPDPNASYFDIWNGSVVGYFGPSGKVTIPAGVTAIGASAFEGVEGMTSLVVPEGVTYIGLSAFGGCYDLRDITLPVSLREIEMEAFDGARGLTDVYYAGSQAQWEQIAVGMDNDPLYSATIHFAQ